MHIAELIRGIEGTVGRLSDDASPTEIARAVVCAESPVVPLKRDRHCYSIVGIPGGWAHDAWNRPARSADDLQRDATRFREAVAVGVILKNGVRYVIDMSSGRLIKFVERVDASFR